MKLIIEIPEEVYEKQRYSQYFGAWSVVLQKCFENGTPALTCGDCIESNEKFFKKWVNCKMLDKIKSEIKRISDEEQKHDEKWAIGLRYAVKIIDKYKNEMLK